MWKQIAFGGFESSEQSWLKFQGKAAGNRNDDQRFCEKSSPEIKNVIMTVEQFEQHIEIDR